MSKFFYMFYNIFFLMFIIIYKGMSESTLLWTFLNHSPCRVFFFYTTKIVVFSDMSKFSDKKMKGTCKI